jgi:hypothetical protein
MSSLPLSVVLSHSLATHPEGAVRSITMDASAKGSRPKGRPSGPRRLTGEAAFNQARKEIAERNDAAQRAGRKVRDATERRKARERRERDLR